MRRMVTVVLLCVCMCVYMSVCAVSRPRTINTRNKTAYVTGIREGLEPRLIFLCIIHVLHIYTNTGECMYVHCIQR